MLCLALGRWEQWGSGQAHAGLRVWELPQPSALFPGNKVAHNLILCFNCLGVIYCRPYIFPPADTSLHVFLFAISTLDR